MVPFWVGRCTTHFRTYCIGDWDVHWGCGILTHGHPNWVLDNGSLLQRRNLKLYLPSWQGFAPTKTRQHLQFSVAGETKPGIFKGEHSPNWEMLNKPKMIEFQGEIKGSQPLFNEGPKQNCWVARWLPIFPPNMEVAAALSNMKLVFQRWF